MTSSFFTPTAACSRYQKQAWFPTSISSSTTTSSLHSIHNQGLSASYCPNVTSSTMITPAVGEPPAGMEVEEDEEEGMEGEVLEMSEYWVERLSKSWGHKHKQGKKK